MQSSVPHKQCKLNLRKKKIQHKKSHKWSLRREYENLRNAFQLKMNKIDFAHVTSIFLSNSDANLNPLRAKDIYIYVFPVPCMQPLYMHLECIKNMYMSLDVGKNSLAHNRLNVTALVNNIILWKSFSSSWIMICWIFWNLF